MVDEALLILIASIESSSYLLVSSNLLRLCLLKRPQVKLAEHKRFQEPRVRDKSGSGPQSVPHFGPQSLFPKMGFAQYSPPPELRENIEQDE